MNYLNIYLQIGILFSIIYFCKHLIRIFKRRFREHRWYLDYMKNGINSFGYSVVHQTEDCKFWLKDYYVVLIEVPFNIIIWPITIFMSL